MNGRERVFNAVHGYPVDHPVAAPYMGNFSITAARKNLSSCYVDSSSMAEAQLAAWNLFRQDVIVVQSDNYYMAEAFGAPVTYEEDDLPSLMGHVCTTTDDVLELKPIENGNGGRMPVYIEAIANIRKEVGDAAAIRGCGTGPFVLAGHLLGIERLLLWIAETEAEIVDHSKELDHLFHVGVETLVGYAAEQLKAGADIIQLADSLASLNVISPKVYRKYVFPYEKEFFRQMKPLCATYGAMSLLHICGDNTSVFEDYATVGADIVAIDHAADLSEAVRVINDRAAIIGNIDPAGILLNGTPSDTCKLACACLDAVLPHRYLLGSGCELSVRTPIENVKAMLEAARMYTPCEALK